MYTRLRLFLLSTCILLCSFFSKSQVGIGTTSPTYNLSFGGNASRTFGMERNTTSGASGNSLTLLAGGSSISGSNLNGGNLILNSGISKGTGTSNIVFKTYSSGASGSTDNNSAERMRITSSGNVLIGIDAETTGSKLAVNGILGILSPDGNLMAISNQTNQYFNMQTYGSKPLYINDFGNDVILNGNSGNVGVGNYSPQRKFHISKDVASSGVVLIENTNNGGAGMGILELSFSNISSPTSGHHFIQFKGNSGVLGSITGNGAGGVSTLSRHSRSETNPLEFVKRSGISFESSGADYAEYIPKKIISELIAPGDIVGVSEGFVSINTTNANQCMVISMRPVVVGNSPGTDKAGYSLVSFLGQVYVRVVGAVKAGDYIVASGKNDGTGVAVSSAEINKKLLHLVVGQAWESSSDAAEKMIKVGITATTPLRANDSGLQDRLHSAEETLLKLQSRLDELEKRLGKGL